MEALIAARLTPENSDILPKGLTGGETSQGHQIAAILLESSVKSPKME
jgi:hypothetical protein